QRPEAWIGRGQAQFNMYRFEEALASFEKGLGRFPRNEALLAAKADLHLSLYTNLREQDEDAASSHWDEAVAGYRSIAESAGGDTLSRYQAYSYQKIAEAHRWREDLEAARSALTEGIERDASASGLYGPLYSAMSSEDRLDELAGFLRQVAERQAGREATPMWYLGYTELQRENWDAAIEAYRRSAQANPEFTAGARSQIAECFVSQGARAQADGDTEMALSYYLRALDADPGHDSAVQGVGSLGASQVSESNEAGRRFFAKVTSMYEDRADWWNNYAFFCRETGKYEESYQAYERALELAPNDARIINDLALILLYHLDRDLDRAEDMFYRSWRLGRDVYEDSTQDPAVRDEAFITFGDAMENLVLLYVQQERWEEAKPICDELLEIQPQRPAAVQYRRRIEQALGEDKSSGDGDDGR
ncbi:MAG: tetratricopeptide repeat protein, partial [Planctomycetota bacterium]